MQEVNTWIMPSESRIELVFKDFDIDFEVSLVLDEDGQLDPIVKSCSIDFGDSYFHHENNILRYAYHDMIKLALVVIENSSYFMGKYMFTELLGPVLDVYLRHYTIDLGVKNWFLGFDQWDTLTFDYRSV